MAKRKQYRPTVCANEFPVRVEEIIGAANVDTPGILVEDLEATIQDLWRRQAELVSQLRSEQKNREAHEQLARLAPVALSLVNGQGEVEFVNDRFVATFGYTLAEIPTLRAWLERAFPDETYRAEIGTSIERTFQETLRQEPEFQTPELKVKCKDGSERIIRISISRADGRYAAVFDDMTERRLNAEKSRQNLAAVQNALNSCIRAAAKMVEMRDPYTAIHQKRVARLAEAMAGELGLPEEQTGYLGMACSVHDIGKIYVPSEILSRTGKLTGLEYAMIQGHVQGGYAILSTIEFPWPIAKIVLQHHERLDGSGYPAGLKGEQIMREARILGVADTVEAMSAHRPYRPALGRQEALHEITRNKGRTFDPQVVDACIQVLQRSNWSVMDAE